jgi:hypothetical protein
MGWLKETAMDGYDNEEEGDGPYSSSWYNDFYWIGGIIAITLLGYLLPKWLG